MNRRETVRSVKTEIVERVSNYLSVMDDDVTSFKITSVTPTYDVPPVVRISGRLWYDGQDDGEPVDFDMALTEVQ